MYNVSMMDAYVISKVSPPSTSTISLSPAYKFLVSE